MPTRAATLLLALVLQALAPSAAHTAEVRTLAANAVKGPLVELVAAFEAATGHAVRMAWGGTEGIAARIERGETVDIVLIGSDRLDRLLADGRLRAGTKREFARSGVGVAIRQGLPRPDVTTADGVREAVLAAGRIAYSSGPSGAYVADMLARMGVGHRIAGRVIQPGSGVQVADLLARGEADLGFQQVSELLHAEGIDYLGPLPAEIQNVTIYALALHPSAAASEAAQTLVRFLTRAEAAPAIVRAGMDPGHNP